MALRVERGKSIRTKFIVSMVVMLLPLVILAYGAYSSLQSALDALEEVIKISEARVAPLQQLQIQLKSAYDPIAGFLVDGDAARGKLAFDQTAAKIDTLFSHDVLAAFELEAPPIAHERPEGGLGVIRVRPTGGDEAANLARLRTAQKLWEDAEKTTRHIFTLDRTKQRAEVEKQVAALQKDLAGATNVVWAVQDQVLASIKLRQGQASDVRLLALVKIGFIFALGLIVALLMGVALARSVLVPLRELENGVEKFGDGELSHRVNIGTQDEIHRLGAAFNEMAEKLKRTQDMLEDLSIHDGLTGLYNYREFHRWLKSEVDRSRRYGRPLSLLMLDIDHFKKVNDTWGHQSGDIVLETVSNLMQKHVRPVDRVARCGGEEFALILPETPIANALAVAERLRQRISEERIPIPASEQPIQITVSVGAACFAVHAATENQLISAADKALYAAKNGGRNQVQQAEIEVE